MFFIHIKIFVICKTVEIIFNSFQQILKFKFILEINHSPLSNMNGWDILYIYNIGLLMVNIEFI